jgi:glutamine amidotransferase
MDAGLFLTAMPRSLLHQSKADPRRKQGDGWGVAWYPARRRPVVYKSAKPIYQDGMRLHHAVERAKGGVLLGHVRWASNPLKLPRRRLIGLPHTQPFVHGPWTFAHNGTLYIPREVKAALGPWARFVRGNNDSEVLFYWLLKTVVHGKGSDWESKVRSSLKGLDAIWAGCRQKYPIFKYGYHGLNWVLTNGEVFLAFCYVDPRGWDQAKALCAPGQPYYALQLLASDQSVQVASEPLTLDPRWRPLGHGRLLIAERNRTNLKMKERTVR